MPTHGINYLNLLPEWSGHGGFSFEPCLRVMNELGDPQEKIKAIHVAGTNGKGSVSAAVAAILGASGKRVGLTISPHLSSLNERIVLDGCSISDDLLDSSAIKVKEAADKLGITLSHFEAITSTAFVAFFDAGVEYMVLETGLGGRLDATNIIKKPLVTAITSIDFDHEAILGDTLGKIAMEKAGIIKKDVPVVLGALSKEAKNVILGKASERGAKARELGKDFSVQRISDFDSDGKLIFRFSCSGSSFEVKPALRGDHQGQNMAVSMAICKEIGCSDKSCREGVESVFWPGRLEELSCFGGNVLIDCGHNPAGVDSTVSYLNSRGVRNIRIVFGALSGKNWTKMVDKLKSLSSNWLVLRPESVRAEDPQNIVQYLSRNGISSKSFGEDYDSALDEIKSSMTRYPLTLITGSIYMIGKIREQLINLEKPLWALKSN